MQTKGKFDVKMIAVLAMLGAMAYGAMFVFKIPLVPAAPWLKYDPQAVLILIGGLIYGPVSALILSLTVAFAEMVTVSESGWWGLLMNAFSSAAFACTAAFIYKHKRTLPGAVMGVVAGWLFVTAAMLPMNYFITPLYRGVSHEVVAGMLVPMILPFNLIKYGFNAAMAMFLYKPLSAALRKLKVLPAVGEGKTSFGSNLIAGAVLAACVAVIPAVLYLLLKFGVIGGK